MPYMHEDEIAEQRDRVAVAVLPHLAGFWAWEPGQASHFGTMRRASDGLDLVLSLDAHRQRARFRVQGPPRRMTYARTLRDYGVIPYNEAEPACTVAWSRPGEAIAADIRRRVLAIADPLWPKVLEQAKAEAQLYVERDRTVAALVRLTNAGVYDRGGDNLSVGAVVSGASLSMDVGPGGNVTLSRLSLTGRQMEAVIMALRSAGSEPT